MDPPHAPQHRGEVAPHYQRVPPEDPMQQLQGRDILNTQRQGRSGQTLADSDFSSSSALNDARGCLFCLGCRNIENLGRNWLFGLGNLRN